MYSWILILALSQETSKDKDVKKYPEWECVSWKWAYDNSRVICLEWRKRENRWIP